MISVVKFSLCLPNLPESRVVVSINYPLNVAFGHINMKQLFQTTISKMIRPDWAWPSQLNIIFEKVFFKGVKWTKKIITYRKKGFLFGNLTLVSKSLVTSYILVNRFIKFWAISKLHTKIYKNYQKKKKSAILRSSRLRNHSREQKQNLLQKTNLAKND